MYENILIYIDTQTTMKSLNVFGIATTVSLTVMAVRGYLQLPSGNTSFTQYSGCGSPG